MSKRDNVYITKGETLNDHTLLKCNFRTSMDGDLLHSGHSKKLPLKDSKQMVQIVQTITQTIGKSKFYLSTDERTARL